MMKAILYCALYAMLNVSGAAIIKWNLKGKVLTNLNQWMSVLLNPQVIGAFALIFVSMLVIFKALSSANFTFVIPVSAGVNFILTVVAGYYIFKDQLSLVSFIGFVLIISGILLLSINNSQHATQ
jgi:multidrug transporter EmrE-like cation transporter